MKLYTSYFYQTRFFPINLIGLSTAAWPPKYLEMDKKNKNGVIIINCHPLRPGPKCEGLCSGNCLTRHPHDCSFLQTYYEQLCQIDFHKFITQLKHLGDSIKQKENIKSEIDFAFLVYEAPQNICSERQIIQRWIKDHNIDIIEWSK